MSGYQEVLFLAFSCKKNDISMLYNDLWKLKIFIFFNILYLILYATYCDPSTII